MIRIVEEQGRKEPVSPFSSGMNSPQRMRNQLYLIHAVKERNDNHKRKKESHLPTVNFLCLLVSRKCNFHCSENKEQQMYIYGSCEMPPCNRLQPDHVFCALSIQ